MVSDRGASNLRNSIKEVSEESQFGAKNFDPLSRSEVKVDLNKELTNSAPPGLGNKKKQSVGKKEIVGEQELVDSAIETFFQVISGLDHCKKFLSTVF